MKRKKIKVGNIVIYVFFIIVCMCMLYPFVCIMSVSLTSGEEIGKSGFGVLPKNIDFSAYIYIFKSPSGVLKAYGTTILVAVLGTAVGGIVTALYAYAISRQTFKLRRLLSFFATFTMYFGGGMASKYIINVSVLHMKNSIWVLILPIAFSAMNMIIMRAYFEQLPYGMVESAKIDGANEFKIFGSIMLPLAKPAIATICLTLFVGYWNAYYEAMMYMDTGNYVTIQLLLHRMLQKVDFIKSYAGTGLLAAEAANLPSESLRMAMCAVTVIPMLCVFPRFQKYFVKGMAIGAVKE